MREAYLFDVYPTSGGMAVWLLTADGRRVRLVHPWAPRLYYAGPADARRRAEAVLQTVRTPVTTREVERRDLLRGEIPVVEVAVADPQTFPRVTRALACLDGLTFYNCDIALPQLYLYEHRLFPLGRCAVDIDRRATGSRGGGAAPASDAAPGGRIRTITPLDSPWEPEYSVPPLTTMRLRLDGDPINPNHGPRAALHVAVEGEEGVLVGDTPGELAASLVRWLERYDPDVLLTEWGDSVLLPRLRRLEQMSGVRLPLSRDPGAGQRTRRARSYVTYGQMVYTAGGVYLHGRWHLDTTNSFTYEEAKLPGLLELARLGRLPVQHAARTSVGTVITSMQLDQAFQDGILVPWRKARPEAFKSAADLLLTDRGGLTYTPLIGAYARVGELDFAAMYPAIMARFNISQETVNCACCRDDPRSRVPGVPHHLCRRRRGLIPRVLERVLARRAYYKRRRAETAGEEHHLYDLRQTALKWVGVVCLDGGTLVLHRSKDRWRMAPIRDIVEPHLPGASTGSAPVDDLTVIGVDTRLRPCPKAVRRVVKTPSPPTMIRLRLRWNRDLLVTPDHPCYVLADGDLRIKRADEVTVGDWVPLATSWQRVAAEHATDFPVDVEHLLRSPIEPAEVLSVERAAAAEPFVYCVQVDGDLPAFFIEGGALTHNCFGYQGYKNARFGQIEAHECTTALSREMLLRTKDLAEARGYRMLHALVDSVWLDRPGATRADYEALAREIEAATDLPIAVEGVYRWIAFVPSRMHPRVGVPNRYFGVFEDGTSKVRGIELRRGDTPPLVAEVQARMLAALFETATLEEARARLPHLDALLDEALVRLSGHEVRAAELVVRTVLSQDPRAYTRGVAQAVAAHRLAAAGVALHPGEAIEYIVANAASPVPADRALPYARLPDDWAYDAEWYARTLRRAADTLLTPFRVDARTRRASPGSTRQAVGPQDRGRSCGREIR